MTATSAIGQDEPTSKFFCSQGLTLHYLDWGNEGAPIVLLVHGGRDHARSWDWVARALRQDYHVIAPDLRGHGDSGWSPDGAYTQLSMIVDLAELIAHLGQDSVSIVAHSLGGSISLRYTGLFPAKVRRVAAIEGIGLAMERGATLTDQLRGFVERRMSIARSNGRHYASLADAEARMRGANHHLSEARIAHLTLHGVRRQEDGGYRWKYDRRLRPLDPVDLTDAQLRSLWGEITCPTWLVHGGDSWAAHPDALGRSAEFGNARVTSFAGAGHWVQHDRFEDFVRELRQFLV